MDTPKILIVDDEPFNADYLEQELAETDCETSIAVNGQDALDQVRAAPPDLVLLDIMMPVMDGFQVLKHLKADPGTRDIPVIVISAYNDLRNIVKGIQLGAEDFLPKPFEPTLLHARISSSLEKKRLRDMQKLYLKGLERELDIAREIQKGFLPAELPRADGWEIAAYLKAAREVAGDFYDAFLLPDGNLVCVIGDVCGKGVGAALFMTLFRSLIRATCTTDYFTNRAEAQILTPAGRLSHVISFTNNYIAETHGDANMFATIFISMFNLQDGTFTYINCGNDPPQVVRDGRVIASLAPTGPAVGIFPNMDFSVGQITLEKDDLFLVYTDGIPDSMNPENDRFGHERLLAQLNTAHLPPAALLEQIEREVYRFVGTNMLYDDITMLAVKRN